MLRRRKLHIQADLLVPIAHWITPEVETRRFDTRFLAAALPAGQDVDAHVTETDSAHWMAPADALAEHRQGRPGHAAADGRRAGRPRRPALGR